MNDFTKEELLSILDCHKIYGDSFSCGLSMSAYETLIDKLQLMIDNFDKSNKSCLCTLRESCPNCAEGF